jgi:hypothetical protein
LTESAAIMTQQLLVCLSLFIITLRRTTLGRTPLDEWSARRRDLYLYSTQHSQQTDFHNPAGFEPTIPTSERLQTHALDRAATGISAHDDDGHDDDDHDDDDDIYLLLLGFHPAAVVGRLVQKIGKRQHKRRNDRQNNTNTQNTKQKSNVK